MQKFTAASVPGKRPSEVLYLEVDNADCELFMKAIAKAEMQSRCDPVKTLKEFTESLAA